MVKWGRFCSRIRGGRRGIKRRWFGGAGFSDGALGPQSPKKRAGAGLIEPTPARSIPSVSLDGLLLPGCFLLGETTALPLGRGDAEPGTPGSIAAGAPARLERAANGSEVRCSIQLSYGGIQKWHGAAVPLVGGWWDSNPQSPGPQPGALTLGPHPPCVTILPQMADLTTSPGWR